MVRFRPISICSCIAIFSDPASKVVVVRNPPRSHRRTPVARGHVFGKRGERRRADPELQGASSRKPALRRRSCGVAPRFVSARRSARPRSCPAQVHQRRTSVGTSVALWRIAPRRKTVRPCRSACPTCSSVGRWQWARAGWPRNLLGVMAGSASGPAESSRTA